jgi:hypothetical protein
MLSGPTCFEVPEQLPCLLLTELLIVASLLPSRGGIGHGKHGRQFIPECFKFLEDAGGYMQFMERTVANYATFDIINRGISIS